MKYKVVWLCLYVDSMRRLENDKIDLVVEQQKLEKILTKIEEQKRGFLEEMKNHTIVRNNLNFSESFSYVRVLLFLLIRVWFCPYSHSVQ